ncbi:hypothetical protein FF38_14231 [Lucilia cuprina]|uniref:Uncharacterized protein n=1 Tax=Lucilia cuprina TaxID=7375 RepID=A0A0L0BS48_LUCCU|nr:hypothetical protein CVS40_1309 [Lucilia cuprina]KNC22054.1 hypothetical protein FF38_14231 [Lucilia cuprina]
MTTNTTTTTTITNTDTTTITTTMTTLTNTTTCTDNKTLVNDTETGSLKYNNTLTNNNNNNALTQINQNNTPQTDDTVKDLKHPKKDIENPENVLNLDTVTATQCIEEKNQSLLKINSSITTNTNTNCKDDNLVSLDIDLDKLSYNNHINNSNLDLVQDNNKLINLNKDTELLTTFSEEFTNVENKNFKDIFGETSNENTLNLTLDKELCRTAPQNLQISVVESFLDSESYKLLQKLPINNPFYRFHKQSNSFREMRTKKTSFNFLTNIRKFKSDTDLCQTQVKAANENSFYFKNNIVVVANQCKKNNSNNTTTITRNQKLDLKFSRQQFNKLQNHHNVQNTSSSPLVGHQTLAQQANATMMLIKPTNDFNNSTVITNPFSIFHDDESHLTLTVDKRLRCASSASRRLIRKPTGTNSSSTSSAGSITLQQSKPFASQQQLNNYHYLYGVPIKKFERQDFPPVTETGTRTKKSKMSSSSSSSSVFKQISLRKMSKTASASTTNIHVPLSGPQLKRLKISYPNHTQPINPTSTPQHVHSHNKNTYFSRLQAKTRQGLQKLKDKCKQFNTVGSQRSHLGRHHNSSSFKTMSKVESFRFISDRDNIRNYETRCMAAYHQDHKQKQGTLYKTYKSELDLSKNLNYLEAYLNQNFEQQQSAQSVGRAQGQKIRRAFHQISDTTAKHKRNNSNCSSEQETPKKLNFSKNNYENVQSLPFNKSDSLSSSDYASVFSANCGEDVVVGHLKNDKTDLSSPHKLRYEHPKMSEFVYDSKNMKLKLNKSSEVDKMKELHHNLVEAEDEEVEDNELVFKQELLRICQTKDAYHYEEEFPLDIPEDDEDELACNNIRILINNSEDFERSPEEDWYMQRSENDNLSEVAFYQSLNEQQLYEERQLNYDPFIAHLHADLYPFNSETEDEKQLLSSSSSLQRSQRLSHSLKYDYPPTSTDLNNKSLHLQDYKTAAENAQLMQSLYKTYQTQTQPKTSTTLSNSSSSTSSIHQQLTQNTTAVNTQTKYKLNNHNSLKTPTNATPTFSNNTTPTITNANTNLHQLPGRRTSTSSSDNFDSFISSRSYQHTKIPSKRSSFTQYQQRSPLTATQPQMNALNYYGVSSSNDTYSIPFKLQSSSSSSNHSSKLSNSSSNSTTSSSHTNPLIIPSAHINSLASATAQTSAGAQINLSKLYNNQNASSSSNTTTSSSTIITNIVPGTGQSLLYNQEKRDKFILEYEC